MFLLAEAKTGNTLSCLQKLKICILLADTNKYKQIMCLSVCGNERRNILFLSVDITNLLTVIKEAEYSVC